MAPVFDDEALTTQRTLGSFLDPIGPSIGETGMMERALPTMARVVPPIAGGIIGGYPGVVGGTLVGNAFAQKMEQSLGQREGFDPLDYGVDVAFGLTPMGRFPGVTGMAARAGLRGTQGAFMAAGAEATRDVLHGRTPTLGELATRAGAGFLMAAPFGAAESYLSRPRPARPLTQPAPPVSPPVTTPMAAETPSGPFTRVPGLHEARTGTPIPAAEPRRVEGLPTDLAQVDRIHAKLPESSRFALKWLVTENADDIAAQVRGAQPIPRTQALAEDILFDPKAVRRGMTANAEELTSAGNHVNAIMQKLERAAAALKANPQDPAARLAVSEAHQELTLATVAHQGLSSETGRALNTLKYQREAGLSGEVKFIQRATKRGANPETIVKMLDMTDPEDQIGRYRLLMSLQKPTPRDYLKWHYLSFIMSHPKTQERNISGNTFGLIRSMGAKPFAAGVERLKGVPAAERETFVGEIPHQAVGLMRGIPEGARKALFMFKNGFTLDDVGQLELRPPEIPGGIAPNIISRSLGAVDQLFKTINFEVGRYGAAFAQAKREGYAAGLHGKALTEHTTARMADLIAETPPNIMAYAARFAQRNVYQEPSQIGRLVNQAKNILSVDIPLGRGRTLQFAPLDYIIPFVRIAANLAKQGAQFTPAGFVSKLGRESGRLGAEARGEAAMGTALMGVAAYLAATGRLTGHGPKDPGERDALYAQGWQPNAIKIGDRYVSYENMGAMSLPFSAVANGFEAVREQAEAGKKIDYPALALTVLAKSAQSFTDLSFMKGMYDTLNAIEDPDANMSRFVQQYAKSLTVPAAVRAVTEVQDPILRKPETATEAIKSVVPGLSETVPPRLRASGAPALRGTSPLLVPDITKAKPDPIRQELDRLGLTLPIPEAGPMVVGNEKIDLTQEQSFALRQAKGTAVYRAAERSIQAPGFQSMSDAQKQRMLEGRMRRARQQVIGRAKMFLRQRRAFTTDDLLR